MCILDPLLTLRMIDRRCFWAKVLAISYGDKIQINQTQGRSFALRSTKARKNAQSCSAKHFQSSQLLQNMTRLEIGSVSADVCCWSNVCVNMQGLWRERERERAQGQRRTRALGWRADGARWGGMCTHGEALLQRVRILLLQVDRKEVGRGRDSDGNRVHTWTMRHQHAKQQEHE